VSLEDLADGWTSDAYAVITPASHTEYRELIAIPDDNKPALIDYQEAMVKKHLVSGKVFVLDDQGAMNLDDIQPEDALESSGLSNRLFAEIMGVTADPKGTPTPTATETPSSPMSDPSSEPSDSTSNTKTQ
jgi:hypothetical protein